MHIFGTSSPDSATGPVTFKTVLALLLLASQRTNLHTLVNKTTNIKRLRMDGQPSQTACLAMSHDCMVHPLEQTQTPDQW